MKKYFFVILSSIAIPSFVFISSRNAYERESIKICNKEKNAKMFRKYFPIPDKNSVNANERDIAISKRDAAINAFTHCYTSAKLTNTYGSFLANMLGDFNEHFESIFCTDLKDSIKDKYNNAVGRSIAKTIVKSKNLERTCLEACKTGVLINSIYDPKIDSILQKRLDYKIPAASITNIMRP